MLSKLGQIVKSFQFRIAKRDQRESLNEDSLSCSIGYYFHNKDLLHQALIHRSVLNHPEERIESNERLEFLGDAILGCIVCDELYEMHPEWEEGQLTKAKSCIVSRVVLARQGQKMNLGDYLYLSPGEEKSGGRNRRSILSDTFEALVGAIYLDGGIDAARHFIQKYLLDDKDRLLSERLHRNYKSFLLEHVQSQGISVPRYHVVNTTGPEHKKVFTVSVVVRGEELGKGTGLTKKRAEQEAAREALIHLRVIEDKEKQRD